MEVIAQKLDDIIATLRPLTVEWQDDTARRVIDILKHMRVKKAYTTHDVQALLDKHFDDGMLICRLFLGLSKDQFVSTFKTMREGQAIGVKSYRAHPDAFIEDLLSTGLLEAMAEEANRKRHWSDVLVERLRSGRGSAISGQKRGRGVEDFAEAIVTKVFGAGFQTRCTFSGQRGQKAKCDFAIPSKAAARILIESKGYGATGSKMTDILGDIRTIVAAKRPDTAFLFFTDGLTWKERPSDLRQILEFQNNGEITRIYTYAMADQFETDLRQLKAEYKL
jgi:DpnII restriction endonuclease